MGGVIKVWQPRYRDNSVLVARYRIACGADIKVEITKGARKGIYKVKNEDIINSPLEFMKTKTGSQIQMRAIPFEKLERVEEWI